MRDAAATSSGPLLRIDDLAVSFALEDGRCVRAVDGLGLSIHAGQLVALVGESGCGKSVTALSTLRLLPEPPARIERGRILYDGRDLLTLPRRMMPEVRGREIAMIFQEPMTSLNPVLSVGDQVVEAIRLHRKVDRRQAVALAAEALADVGIADPRVRLRAYPHEFSGGMRQRVMIAMALACRPRLLLADEPTTALDVTIQAQILALLDELRHARHLAVMLITHDLCVVAEHADVVCVMHGGRVVEYARTRVLLERPHHPYTRGLLGCLPDLRRRRRRLPTVEAIVSDPGEYDRLPGFRHGAVPWWPQRPPPDELAGTTASGGYCLSEIEPEHWVACWGTAHVRRRPSRAPDIYPGSSSVA